MNEFEIGDRVRVISVNTRDEKYYNIGFTGTVTGITQGLVLIKFDQETHHTKKFQCLSGVSWACGVEEVEIVM